ncbi:MAG TPA: EamA family transporter, partial [Spirochaetia bacterium]|nr:EamA family transporter [Spirochaetia bacterium]
MGVLLAGLSALLYGSADFAGGYASRRASAMSVVVVSQIFGVLTALAAAPFVGTTEVSPVDLLWGGVAGIGGAVGLIALYRGIAGSVVAIVSPTAALLGAVFPVLFGLLIGEQPALLAWIGIALCLPAVGLLSFGGRASSDAHRTLASFLFGAVAGVGFACFYIAISRPSSGAGLWPLVAARAV